MLYAGEGSGVGIYHLLHKLCMKNNPCILPEKNTGGRSIEKVLSTKKTILGHTTVNVIQQTVRASGNIMRVINIQPLPQIETIAKMRLQAEGNPSIEKKTVRTLL